MVDIVREIDAVEREVGGGRLDGAEARTVVLRRRYEASVDDVWDALTSPERIPAGSCRSAATTASAVGSSSRATPVARSWRAIGHIGCR